MSAAWETLDRFAFGDSAELADALAALVLAGLKRATCWAVSDGPQTAVGKCTVMLDGAGRPRAVLRTLSLEQRRFDQVDADFAFQEGEGDRSLAFWRRVHQEYFSRRGQFAADMMLYCERFDVVEVLAP